MADIRPYTPTELLGVGLLVGQAHHRQRLALWNWLLHRLEHEDTRAKISDYLLGHLLDAVLTAGQKSLVLVDTAVAKAMRHIRTEQVGYLGQHGNVCRTAVAAQ